jgi:hypothetical protein
MCYVKCAETSAVIVGLIGCLRVKSADTSMQVNAAAAQDCDSGEVSYGRNVENRHCE